jgi:hypothetical protein
MVQRTSIRNGGGDGSAVPDADGNVNSVVIDRYFGVFESKEDLIERSTLAGQIGPVIRKFVLSRKQVQAIVEGIRSIAQVSDICLLITIGWVLVPLVGLWYDRITAESAWGVENNSSAGLSSSSVTGDSDVDSRLFTMTSNEVNDSPRPFEKTKIYHFFNTLSEIARLATMVYAADLAQIFLLGAGFDIPKSNKLTHVFMYIVCECASFSFGSKMYVTSYTERWTSRTSIVYFCWCS